MKYTGLDVHKKYIYGTVLDERGRVVKRGKFEYAQNGFEEFLRCKGSDGSRLLLATSLRIA